MMSTELWLVGALRAIVEVALLSLLGQALVGFLAGPSRGSNPVYGLFALVGRPPIRLMRVLTPRVIVDKHIPYLTFFVLFWLWIALAYVKRWLCGPGGVC
jgi:hypothetical protein